MFGKHVRLTFDDDKDTYIGGETISGTISLDLSEATKVSEITLKIKGSGHLSWELERKGTSISKNSRQRPVIVSAGKDFLESEITIWKPGVPTGTEESDDPNKISAGEHKFIWSFQLSKSLPSSYKTVFGFIKYYVKVKVDRPWAIDWEDEKKFNVIELCDLARFPRTKDEITKRGNTFAGYLCFNRKAIDAVVKLPSAGLITQESFPIEVQITNKSPRNISYSALYLKQICKMHIRKHTQERHETVFTHKQGTIAAGETSNWDDVMITLPPIPTTGGSWDNLQIQYELKFVVQTSWRGPRLKMKWPVVIGTHLSSNESGEVGNAYQGATPAPYSGVPPAPYPGAPPATYQSAAPVPYPGAAPSPYPSAAPGPYPGASPAPYPGAVPTPYPNTAPMPYTSPQPAPYPGAQQVPYPGAQQAPYPGAQQAPFPGAQPSPFPGGQPSPYPGAQSSPYPGAHPGVQQAPYPSTQPGPYPSAQQVPYPSAQPGPYPCAQPAPFPGAPPTTSPPYPVTNQSDKSELASSAPPSDFGRPQAPYPGDTSIGGLDAPEPSAPPP